MLNKVTLFRTDPTHSYVFSFTYQFKEWVDQKNLKQKPVDVTNEEGKTELDGWGKKANNIEE